MQLVQPYNPNPLLKYVMTACMMLFCINAFSQKTPTDSTCRIDNLPSIYFDNHSSKLNKERKAQLDTIAQKLKLNTYCSINISAYCCTERGDVNTLAWERVRNVIQYLVNKKGVSEDRINYNDGRLDENVLVITPVNEKFFDRTTIAHPNYRSRASLPDNASTYALQDSDGDGVINQFDLEPDTPSGAEVDSHGRAVDTDGDSVPDYKDKEKLTLQECFPVNKDGVGTCPEPACCQYLHPNILIDPKPDCNISSIIKYDNGSITLTKAIKMILNSIVFFMQSNPFCKIEIAGYCGNPSIHRQQQLSWDRVYLVIDYLIGKQISAERLFFSYNNQGSAGIIRFLSTTENDPALIVCPYPQFTRIKKIKQLYNQ